MKLLAFAVLLLLVPPVVGDHASGIQWACGGGRTPADCGIDPVGGEGVDSEGDPEWGSAWISNDERIVGVAVAGEAVAVPVKMLDRHEIVNAVVGGFPVAITFCPLCGSGLTFDRRVEIGPATVEMDFTASGYLYQHDLVMWDPQTETLWNQISGSPIGTLREGSLSTDHIDAQLQVLPTTLTTWGGWQDAHPDARMLQPVPGFRYGGAYAGYDESCRLGISNTQRCDIEGLHPKELVVGVTGTSAVAFPLAALDDAGRAVFSGVAVSIDEAGQVRAFDAADHEVDDGWDLQQGLGPEGQRLASLEATTLFWFAWEDHYPDTELWWPEGFEAMPLDGGLSNAAMLAIWAGATVAIFWLIMFVVRRRQ